MSTQRRILGAAGAAAALAVLAVVLYRGHADDKPPAPADTPELTAVKQTSEAFTKAFNAGDAKAVAAFWTKEGEYVGPDDETIHGRDAIEKSYVELFKAQPKATIEINVASVKMLGRYTALEEGTLKIKLPGDPEPGVSHYSALHVREDDAWKMASVREWIPDPQTDVTVKDVAWLLGEWTGKGTETELRINFVWDEENVFLRGRYSLKRGDKVVQTGTQIIGGDPAGGLRSWNFDSNGSFAESVWAREENGWLIETAGTLPDGSESTSLNVLVPYGKDAYTWQSIERTAAGTALPATAPVKMTRIKSDK